LRIPGNIFRQKFQGDEATEFGVFGSVDNAHPAAELFDNAIMRDVLAYELGLTSHWEKW